MGSCPPYMPSHRLSPLSISSLGKVDLGGGLNMLSQDYGPARGGAFVAIQSIKYNCRAKIFCVFKNEAWLLPSSPSLPEVGLI